MLSILVAIWSLRLGSHLLRHLRSKGAAYAEYQRTTSMFLPWPPKKTPARFSP